MGEMKELHYRDNFLKHVKKGVKWCLTIIGIPIGALYFLLASVEFMLIAFHWTLNVFR